MKRPTAASLKKVTAGNLEALGAARLAELLVEAAQARPDLKRRLRMELAAEQGAEPLSLEIDKRLGSLAASRGKIGWRVRPAFVRDLDALRVLIVDRLAPLDRAAAVERIWRLIGSAPAVFGRLRDKDGVVGEVFGRAAGDLGRLIADADAGSAAGALVASISASHQGWPDWLPKLLSTAPPSLATSGLFLINQRQDVIPRWRTLVRQLADVADDLGAYVATYSAEALATPACAAEVGARYLAHGRLEEAGAVLRAAAPKPTGAHGRLAPPDFGWETAWIDYLDKTGEGDAAQAIRWSSFERTLAPERLRAFTARLSDFEDVEAEQRGFDLAARHRDFAAGLRFLIGWPALPEAAATILKRPDEVVANAEEAELWAAKLRTRQPAAAHLLLRKAAAAAFRRREFKVADRLTAEADAI